MIDITDIIKYIIALAVAVATAFIIPYIKSKHDNEEISKVINIVTSLVKCAEQVGKTLGFDGPEKKEFVINRLMEMGYKIDAAIDTYIEAAVLELHNLLVK